MDGNRLNIRGGEWAVWEVIDKNLLCAAAVAVAAAATAACLVVGISLCILGI